MTCTFGQYLLSRVLREPTIYRLFIAIIVKNWLINLLSMAASMEAPEITSLVTNKELIETFFELDHISNQHACRYEDCKQR